MGTRSKVRLHPLGPWDRPLIPEQKHPYVQKAHYAGLSDLMELTASADSAGEPALQAGERHRISPKQIGITDVPALRVETRMTHLAHDQLGRRVAGGG